MDAHCPHCGCNDVNILSDPETVEAVLTEDGVTRPPWTVPGRGDCNHCGKGFSFTGEPEVVEHRRPLTFNLLCPLCSSSNTEVVSSPKASKGWKKRFCKCHGCGHSFKTHDKVDNQPDLHTR